jgi:hypothetical protein
VYKHQFRDFGKNFDAYTQVHDIESYIRIF